jgi:BMFP domain-containing protein YqiC
MTRKREQWSASRLESSSEQSHERLLQALRDIQADIDSHVRPVARQVIQTEVERLRSLSAQQKSILNDCFMRIDRTILDCRSQMEEYRQTRSDLAALNQQLASLGAEPMPIPNHLPTELGDLILARAEELRAEGKI